MNRTLAVDVGGSDLKLATLGVGGVTLTETTRTPTPRPATPARVLEAIVSAASDHRPFDRVAVGFPGVVENGYALNAPNMDGAWDEIAIEQRLSSKLACPVVVANDADVAGLGVLNTVTDSGRGVELVITLGTGLGAGLFVDGRLVPNLELGHLPFDGGRTFEGWLGKAGLAELGRERWQQRLVEALSVIRRAFNPARVYLGGGHARLVDASILPSWVTIVGNRPGLLGCAFLYAP